jgi:hypothetical protein
MGKKLALGFILVLVIPSAFSGKQDKKKQGNITYTQPGEVKESGYNLHYRSGTGKGVRRYELKNSKDSVDTPVFWQGTEVFLKYTLPGCSKKEEPKWEGLNKTSIKVDKPKTKLGIGWNYDEVNSEPIAYDEDLTKTANTKKPVALTTSFNGKIVVKKGKKKKQRGETARINFVVSSSVKKPTLIYSFAAGKGGVPLAFGKKAKERMRIRWKTVENTQFITEASRYEEYVLKPASEKALVIIIRCGRYKVKKGDLVIYSGDKEVFSTTASAYVPSEE